MLQVMLEDREAERAERQANIAALQQLANNNHGHGNHDYPGSKLKNFQNTNPPVFSKTEEPLDADDWLQTMENNLEVAGVDANEKVLFATHYLGGPARAWRTSTRAKNAGQFMTWADFKLKFSKYHVPPGLIKKMRDEFRELKQGRMSVVEYRDRFLTLSRYAPDETDTAEKREERFLNGLHDEMQTVLVNIPFADLEALVDSAIQMEGKLHQANENRKRRKMNQSSMLAPESLVLCRALHSVTNNLHAALDSYWFDKPWFLTEGNLLLYASHLPLGVHNGRVLYASTWAQQYPKVSPQLKRRLCPKEQQVQCTNVTSGFSEPEWRKPRPGRHHNNNNYNYNNNNNNNNNNNRAPPRAPNNNNNTNTAPRTGSNAIPVATKDKATITCYECGVVGHYSNECPKRLAKIAANTAAPAQQQRRVSIGKKFTPNNPNNRGGSLFHMNAEEAEEAPDVVLDRDVEFIIELIPGTGPIAQRAYSMNPAELVELKKQLDDMLYKVASTVGHGTSSLRATARPYSPVRRPVASGRMIATGNFFHIQPSTYRPASSPLKHAWMVPIGSINLFMACRADPTEPPLRSIARPFAPGQLLTATRPVTGEVYTEAESALEDNADSAAMAPIADSIITASAANSVVTVPAADSGVAAFDADSIATASVAGSTAVSPTAGSIATASFKDSISLVSHPSDFEDDSVLSLFGSDSDSDSVEAPRYRYPTAVFMAGGEEEPPVDAFTTPLPATATATEIEAHRAALEEQRKKELAERQKFRLEQDEVRAVSHYRQQRNRLRMERPARTTSPARALTSTIQMEKFGSPESRTPTSRKEVGPPPIGRRMEPTTTTTATTRSSSGGS
ncbi:hypothetical protein QYE76_034668 [Lolium multiflorum]|uniref:CCHC-type domain-containing protein n=1 Tax=Lolium multiflorum TaxID=4521 RepID=A0AAD8QXJ8_LOLMU|nr:hypothetical protein QYE76_034668 [Lolium multiflorum]